MGTPLSGVRSTSASKGKAKTWANEYEKLGVAIMNHVKRTDARDDGDFIVKDQVNMQENAMRGDATLVVSGEAREAFSLPELVINDTVTSTYGYDGVDLGDPITVEYERLRAWRDGAKNYRTAFLSKEFLEKRGLHHAGPGVYTSFLSKKSPSAASEYQPTTLEVTEPFCSALFIFTQRPRH